MKRSATIVAVDPQQGTLVELNDVSQCRLCDSGQGCGATLLRTPGKGVTLWINNDRSGSVSARDLAPGQSVNLAFEDQGSAWLLPVAAAYALPLAGMILATLLATGITTGLAPGAGIFPVSQSIAVELIVASSAGGGLIFGIVLWRKISARLFQRVERGLCLDSARIVP